MTAIKERDVVDGWTVVSVYTTEQAEADGVIVRAGYVERRSVVFFTDTLMARGYADDDKRRQLVERGLKLLDKPDKEDTAQMKLRVIDKDTWVVEEPGKLTFMAPQDY